MGNIPKVEKINILILEGLAIFFVMLVHSGTPNQVYAFFSYGLGALVFARGYQWKERSLKEILSSRILLVQTYYFAGLINTIVFLLIAPPSVVKYPKYEYFLNLLIGRMDRLDQVAVNAIPLWFFLMLFLAELMYYFVSKNNVLLIISIALALVLRMVPHEPLVFKIDAAIVSLPFFWLGKIWKKYNVKVSLLGFVLTTGGLLLISQTNGDISWNNQWFGKNGVIAFFGEFFAIIVIIFLSEVVKVLKVDGFFYKLAFNALFVIAYHMLLGSLLYVILSAFGIVIPDVMKVLNKMWYIYFAFDLAVVYLAIRYIPARVKSFLIGDFRRVVKRVR